MTFKSELKFYLSFGILVCLVGLFCGLAHLEVDFSLCDFPLVDWLEHKFLSQKVLFGGYIPSFLDPWIPFEDT